MFKLGMGYQVTSALNVGARSFHAKQSGSTTGRSDGKANFLIVAARLAFSKRTDAYVALDNTHISGGEAIFLDSVPAKPAAARLHSGRTPPLLTPRPLSTATANSKVPPLRSAPGVLHLAVRRVAAGGALTRRYCQHARHSSR